METPQAGILAIGTELTNGQIINRNASWISQKLLELGMTTKAHVTIPDDRPLIDWELKNLAGQVSLLFVTGGLGPTTDDFTRDCISAWSQKKLQWDEGSWEWIQNRFKERNMTLREFQKQQCYYPEGAKVLTNPLGTAHGFYLNHQGLDVFVLPGPPKEIEIIWKLHIQNFLQEKFKGIDRSLVKSWDCFGVGESEVAHKAETALKDCPFEKGYRVHLPYVEFKLFYKHSQAHEAASYFEKIEQALKPWVVARDGKEASHDFVQKIKSAQEICIQDSVTQGFLWERLSPALKEAGLSQKLHFTHLASAEAMPKPRPGQLQLRIAPLADREVQIEWLYQQQKHLIRTHSPYRSIMMQERERQFFAEKAILFWASQNDLC